MGTVGFVVGRMRDVQERDIGRELPRLHLEPKVDYSKVHKNRRPFLDREYAPRRALIIMLHHGTI
jgi:hypothetical protein